MDNITKADYSIYVNGQNPILSTEEIEIIYSFFRIFENEHKRASLDTITQNITTMEEFNTDIVRRVLDWMSKHSNSPCKIIRRGLPNFYETDNITADAIRQPSQSQAVLRPNK